MFSSRWHSTICRARSSTRISDLRYRRLQRPLQRDVPGAAASCLQPGRPYPDFLRYLAEHGYYGEGEVDALVARRVESLRNPSGHELRGPRAGRPVVSHSPPSGGRRRRRHGDDGHHRAEAGRAGSGETRKPSSTLPSTICRERLPIRTKTSISSSATTVSRKCTGCPRELLLPGRPYADFLRYLAENGYYGEGDVNAMVAQRVESLRNPSGKSFEDHTPDGRWYRILRRRTVGGGTVTVMTDITEQKQAEQDL